MHDGGDKIEFMINGKTVCVSNAIYGDAKNTVKMNDGMNASSIIGMSRCHERIQLNKGDKLAITGHYDTSKHQLQVLHSTLYVEGLIRGLGGQAALAKWRPSWGSGRSRLLCQLTLTILKVIT
jgi:hypothetical protein